MHRYRRLIHRYRICRAIPTRSGERLVNVGLVGITDALTLHAASADLALARAKKLVADTRNLVAIPEAN